MDKMNSYQSSTGQANTKLLTDVRFGMTSKKCRNFGICEVKEVNKLSAIVGRSKKRAICSMEVTKEGKLKCDFNLNSITESGRLKYFGGEYFKMGEAYCLTVDISSSLGINPAEIKADNYPIHQGSNDQRVEVLFELDYLDN